jgi:CHAD domain-containing protein/RNase P/RNase MRP subunit p29
MQEREVKLAAAPTFVMPDLSTLGDDVRVAIAEPLRTLTTYLDTDDLRLARAGVIIRLRTGEGWTVKLPGNLDDGVLSRPEFTFLEETQTPPTAATDLVLAYVRTARLAPAARLRTVRRRILLDDLEGVRLLEVDDDEVSVLGEHGRVVARFRELEVEFTDDAPSGLVDATVYLLRTAGTDGPDATSKYVHVLGPRARQAPDVTVEPLTTKPTAGEIVRHALSESVASLLRHDAIVRLDEDTEGVHQMRVATRRLRSNLRTFRPLVDRAWEAPIRDELAWLGTLLGATRDADVLLERLLGRIAASPNPDEASALVDRLRTQRAAAVETLRAALRGERYLQLLDTLVAAAREPMLSDDAQEPAERLLAALQEDWDRLHKRVKRSTKHPRDDQLHRIRMLAKRCRYGAEALEPLVGKDARAVARASERLQGVLGERHDAIVFRTWLHDQALAMGDPTSAFAAGEFAGEELVGLVRSRDEWRPAWRRFAATREPVGWRR